MGKNLPHHNLEHSNNCRTPNFNRIIFSGDSNTPRQVIYEKDLPTPISTSPWKEFVLAPTCNIWSSKTSLLHRFWQKKQDSATSFDWWLWSLTVCDSCVASLFLIFLFFGPGLFHEFFFVRSTDLSTTSVQAYLDEIPQL